MVREIHAHHERRRRELCEQHGSLYEDFENLHNQLNHLSNELHLLTEHGVALDANFSKFGYDAHLSKWTKAHPMLLRSDAIFLLGTKEPTSRSNSMSTQDNLEKHDWEAELRNGQALKFWKKPVIRQYFHKGLLWRASDIEEVMSFELFVDLLYVGIIDIVGESAAEHPDGFGLLKFVITFVIGWKMWNDLTIAISWFGMLSLAMRILKFELFLTSLIL